MLSAWHSTASGQVCQLSQQRLTAASHKLLLHLSAAACATHSTRLEYLKSSYQACLQAALEQAQAEAAHAADSLADLTAEAGARLAADEQVGAQVTVQGSCTQMCMLLSRCCHGLDRVRACTGNPAAQLLLISNQQ